MLVERALDETALQFQRAGTVWEFYHPRSGDPMELKRKPQTPTMHRVATIWGTTP